MQTRGHHVVFPIVIGILLIAGLIMYQYVMPTLRIQSNAELITENAVISPVPLQPTPNITQTVVDAADGTKKLHMRIAQADGLLTYTFFTSDSNDNDQQTIFVKNVSQGETMGIPDNTWSPDNKYIFLLDTLNNTTSIYILKSDGTDFLSGQGYLDVTALFMHKKIQYTFRQATGWASPTLLIIATANGENKGPLFWFDIPSQSFIQLAR